MANLFESRNEGESKPEFSAKVSNKDPHVQEERKKLYILAGALISITVVVMILVGIFGGDKSENPKPSPSPTISESPSQSASPSSNSPSPSESANDTEKGLLKPGETTKPVLKNFSDKTGSCGTDEHGLVILADRSVSCDKASQMVEKTIENGEYSDGDFYCEEVDWAGYEESQFSYSVDCKSSKDSKVRTLPQGTKTIEGKPVVADEYAGAVSNVGIVRYNFTVPGTDFQCSIIPDYKKERGSVGCNGTFDPSALSDDGQKNPNAVELDHSGSGFFITGDTSFGNVDDKGNLVKAKPLKNGETIYAYGVSCGVSQTTLTCFAGDQEMKLSPTSHKTSE